MIQLEVIWEESNKGFVKIDPKSIKWELMKDSWEMAQIHSRKKNGRSQMVQNWEFENGWDEIHESLEKVVCP